MKDELKVVKLFQFYCIDSSEKFSAQLFSENIFYYVLEPIFYYENDISKIQI